MNRTGGREQHLGDGSQGTGKLRYCVLGLGGDRLTSGCWLMAVVVVRLWLGEVMQVVAPRPLSPHASRQGWAGSGWEGTWGYLGQCRVGETRCGLGLGSPSNAGECRLESTKVWLKHAQQRRRDRKIQERGQGRCAEQRRGRFATLLPPI